MRDARVKLATASEISSSTLAFLESMNSYLGSTDEYLAKAKSVFSRKETDKTEKSYLSESLASLKERAGKFNERLKLFNEQTVKDEPLITAVAAYDRLLAEMVTPSGAPEVMAHNPAGTGHPAAGL